MHYTIGEMAKVMGVSPSTLRYYDKEGLLPFVERSDGGKRMFSSEDLEWLYVIDCLKKAGMPIKDIRTYIEWAVQGDETIGQLLELFRKRREDVKQQIEELQKTLALLDYKCWYYEAAEKAGTTDIPRSLDTQQIPEAYQATRATLDSLRCDRCVSF
jgi:DNA-binding transcriptional MerR regulator